MANSFYISRDEFEDYKRRVRYSVAAVGGASEVTVYPLKTILTDAQIKALPSDFIELVAAPGAGKMIVFHKAGLTWKTGSAAYTNVNVMGRILVGYGDWDFDASALTNIYDTNGNLFVPLTSKVMQDTGDWDGYVLNTGNNLAIFENAPLKLIGYNSSGNLTGGHASNTLEVTVFYSIVDL